MKNIIIKIMIVFLLMSNGSMQAIATSLPLEKTDCLTLNSLFGKDKAPEILGEELIRIANLKDVRIDEGMFENLILYILDNLKEREKLEFIRSLVYNITINRFDLYTLDSKKRDLIVNLNKYDSRFLEEWRAIGNYIWHYTKEKDIKDQNIKWVNYQKYLTWMYLINISGHIENISQNHYNELKDYNPSYHPMSVETLIKSQTGDEWSWAIDTIDNSDEAITGIDKIGRFGSGGKKILGKLIEPDDRVIIRTKEISDDYKKVVEFAKDGADTNFTDSREEAEKGSSGTEVELRTKRKINIRDFTEYVKKRCRYNISVPILLKEGGMEPVLINDITNLRRDGRGIDYAIQDGFKHILIIVEKRDDYTIIKIRDNGPGMSDEIFYRHFLLAANTTKDDVMAGVEDIMIDKKGEGKIVLKVGETVIEEAGETVGSENLVLTLKNTTGLNLAKTEVKIDKQFEGSLKDIIDRILKEYPDTKYEKINKIMELIRRLRDRVKGKHEQEKILKHIKGYIINLVKKDDTKLFVPNIEEVKNFRLDSDKEIVYLDKEICPKTWLERAQNLKKLEEFVVSDYIYVLDFDSDLEYEMYAGEFEDSNIPTIEIGKTIIVNTRYLKHKEDVLLVNLKLKIQSQAERVEGVKGVIRIREPKENVRKEEESEEKSEEEMVDSFEEEEIPVVESVLGEYYTRDSVLEREMVFLLTEDSLISFEMKEAWYVRLREERIEELTKRTKKYLDRRKALGLPLEIREPFFSVRRYIDYDRSRWEIVKEGGKIYLFEHGLRKSFGYDMINIKKGPVSNIWAQWAQGINFIDSDRWGGYSRLRFRSKKVFLLKDGEKIVDPKILSMFDKDKDKEDLPRVSRSDSFSIDKKAKGRFVVSRFGDERYTILSRHTPEFYKDKDLDQSLTVRKMAIKDGNKVYTLPTVLPKCKNSLDENGINSFMQGLDDYTKKEIEELRYFLLHYGDMGFSEDVLGFNVLKRAILYFKDSFFNMVESGYIDEYLLRKLEEELGEDEEFVEDMDEWDEHFSFWAELYYVEDKELFKLIVYKFALLYDYNDEGLSDFCDAVKGKKCFDDLLALDPELEEWRGYIEFMTSEKVKVLDERSEPEEPDSIDSYNAEKEKQDLSLAHFMFLDMDEKSKEKYRLKDIKEEIGEDLLEKDIKVLLNIIRTAVKGQNAELGEIIRELTQNACNAGADEIEVDYYIREDDNWRSSKNKTVLSFKGNGDGIGLGGLIGDALRTNAHFDKRKGGIGRFGWGLFTIFSKIKEKRPTSIEIRTHKKDGYEKKIILKPIEDENTGELIDIKVTEMTEFEKNKGTFGENTGTEFKIITEYDKNDIKPHLAALTLESTINKFVKKHYKTIRKEGDLIKEKEGELVIKCNGKNLEKEKEFLAEDYIEGLGSLKIFRTKGSSKDIVQDGLFVKNKDREEYSKNFPDWLLDIINEGIIEIPSGIPLTSDRGDIEDKANWLPVINEGLFKLRPEAAVYLHKQYNINFDNMPYDYYRRTHAYKANKDVANDAKELMEKGKLDQKAVNKYYKNPELFTELILEIARLTGDLRRKYIDGELDDEALEQEKISPELKKRIRKDKKMYKEDKKAVSTEIKDLDIGKEMLRAFILALGTVIPEQSFCNVRFFSSKKKTIAQRGKPVLNEKTEEIEWEVAINMKSKTVKKHIDILLGEGDINGLISRRGKSLFGTCMHEKAHGDEAEEKLEKIFEQLETILKDNRKHSGYENMKSLVKDLKLEYKKHFVVLFTELGGLKQAKQIDKIHWREINILFRKIKGMQILRKSETVIDKLLELDIRLGLDTGSTHNKRFFEDNERLCDIYLDSEKIRGLDDVARKLRYAVNVKAAVKIEDNKFLKILNDLRYWMQDRVHSFKNRDNNSEKLTDYADLLKAA